MKDDSDKENVILRPLANKQKGSLTEGGTSKNADPLLKDPCPQSEHPLAERTQVRAADGPREGAKKEKGDLEGEK